MAANNLPLFPPRPSYLCHANLKKELELSGLATKEECKDPIILLKSEIQLLRDLTDGKLTCSVNHAPILTLALRGYSDLDERKRRADDRKAKMLAFDEERRNKGESFSMEELEKQAMIEQQLERARTKHQEDFDEAKMMNQLMQYAKCVTVRDAQILEKKAIAAERAEEERRQDMMMELERLKAIRMYEEREAKRREDQKRGAAIVAAQIDEVELERLRQMELRQQEQEAMIRHLAKMKETDAIEQNERKENAKRLMEDVTLANAEQTRLKQKQHEMEMEEDRQIAEYIKQKQLRDQELANEQSRIKAEKDREAMRLLSIQEKFQEKQGELDEIRAQRAQQAKYREDRIKEAADKARQKAVYDDLKRANEHQMHEKELLLADEAKKEQEEFYKILAVQKEVEEQVRRERERLDRMKAENALVLQKQIAEVEEQRRKTRREKLEEGQNYLAEQREREATIDAIRKRKLEELEQLQVPLQYRQELMKKRLKNMLRPANAKNL